MMQTGEWYNMVFNRTWRYDPMINVVKVYTANFSKYTYIFRMLNKTEINYGLLPYLLMSYLLVYIIYIYC